MKPYKTAGILLPIALVIYLLGVNGPSWTVLVKYALNASTVIFIILAIVLGMCWVLALFAVADKQTEVGVEKRSPWYLWIMLCITLFIIVGLFELRGLLV